MYFYEILMDIMHEKSLSIPDVARMSNLADSTIRSILSRKTKTVALEVAFKLSKGLNISLERLNGDEANNTIDLSDDEKKLVISYRNNPNMHDAVKRLLNF